MLFLGEGTLVREGLGVLILRKKNSAYLVRKTSHSFSRRNSWGWGDSSVVRSQEAKLGFIEPT